MHRRNVLIAALFLAVAVPDVLHAQTLTLHFHKEKDSGGNTYLLRTAAPDAAAFAIATADLKNTSYTYPGVGAFSTESSSMNNGVIPANATFSISVWMKKSAAVGTVFPRLDLRVDVPGQELSVCVSNGSTALTTTLTQYTLSCSTSSAITVLSSTKFNVYVDGYFSVLPGNHSLTLELDVEGTLNGNYDSRFIVPQPVQA
jgi:hypothetical protein